MAQRDRSQGWGFVYLDDKAIMDLLKQAKGSIPQYPPTNVKSVNLHKNDAKNSVYKHKNPLKT